MGTQKPEIERIEPPAATCAGLPCRQGVGCRNPWCPFACNAKEGVNG